MSGITALGALGSGLTPAPLAPRVTVTHTATVTITPSSVPVLPPSRLPPLILPQRRRRLPAVGNGRLAHTTPRTLEVGRLQPLRQRPFLRHAHRHQRQDVTSPGGIRPFIPSTTPVRSQRPLERFLSMGQIAIALYHSRARPATARREGSGHHCQHRSRRTRSAHRRLFNTIHPTYDEEAEDQQHSFRREKVSSVNPAFMASSTPTPYKHYSEAALNIIYPSTPWLPPRRVERAPADGSG